MVSPKTVFGIAAGVCGTLILGYCIYFDKQRHNDPDFKKKLRERRKAQRTVRMAGKKSRSTLPDMKDHEAVQRFFLQEVQLGEELLASGELETGVEHLGNAVAVCGQPEQLLHVLQQTLPPQVFHLLVHRLPSIAPRMQSSEQILHDEDVE